MPLITVCGLEELDRHRDRGVTHVLSILDPNWPEPESFWTYEPHHRMTLHFHDAIEPGPDLVLPKLEHVQEILSFGRSLERDSRREDTHLLVHCHARRLALHGIDGDFWWPRQIQNRTKT